MQAFSSPITTGDRAPPESARPAGTRPLRNGQRSGSHSPRAL